MDRQFAWLLDVMLLHDKVVPLIISALNFVPISFLNAAHNKSPKFGIFKTLNSRAYLCIVYF